MVSSQLPGSTKNRLLFPVNSLDTVVSDHVELDFTDVFGPLPSIDVNCGDPLSVGDGSELIYDNPVVIHNRSHSLVGPSSYVSQSLKLSKLNLNETEDSMELVKCVLDDTIKELEECSIDDDAIEKDVEGVSGDTLEVQTVGIEDFEVLKVVGQGAFGKVYQVRKKGTPEIYAMKVMRKDRIVEKNHVDYMRGERDILTKIAHPFIVQLKYSFQTKYRLYLVLDFINGGHLFFQLYNHGLFREDLARIYAAEIVSAVCHLHANGIMHRDLKPENILLDSDGHVMLTDFGLAKQFDENTRSNSMCGTVEYMAPEIVQGRGHDKAADWWSAGILLYEMLTGKPPFVGGNRDKIQQKIVKDKIKLPSFLTSEAHTLLKGLLNKDASKRLGSGPLGSEEIKRHKWFKAINWKKLDAREIQPSFRPNVAGKHCIANFDKCWTDMTLSDSPAASPKMNTNPNEATRYHFVRFEAANKLCLWTESNSSAEANRHLSGLIFSGLFEILTQTTLNEKLEELPPEFLAGVKHFSATIPDELLENTLQQDQFPAFQIWVGAIFRVLLRNCQIRRIWGLLVFAGVACLYLTARPGILIGAIDAYHLAPLQLLFMDSLTGRRNLKRGDFLRRRCRRGELEEQLQLDERFKEKVILKKGQNNSVKLRSGLITGCQEQLPEPCAKFLGSFVADKTSSHLTKGGKWPLCKLIDFGAATDLRIGKNYIPDQSLLDPDYCPPELFVLPEETPSPPPEPVAALLSPVIWQLNSPDLFDTYSAGIVLLQMAIPSLRPVSGLKNFNTEIKKAGYDLNKWRESTRLRPDLTILELDSGRGWDLATKLISERGYLGRGRLSAAAALRHPYFLLGGDQAAAVLSKLSLTK
ncbi:hypothetical protein NC652_015204 [Populus alba x Populus x berolinensis]|nr:hypothetical protein NC652_015204 [Populus alba x Populus x berolinensis]